MKKNKILKHLILTIITSCFVGANIALAATDYNGNTGSYSSSPGSGNCSKKGICKYQKGVNFLAFKVRLLYVNNGNIENNFHEEYWGNSDAHSSFSNVYEKGFLNSIGNYDYSAAKNAIENEFKKNDWALVKEWYQKYATDKTKVSEDSNEKRIAGKYAVKGYRIIIEPMFRYLGDGNYYLYTPKGIAYGELKGAFGGNRSRLNEASGVFFVSYYDVGINSDTEANCKNTAAKEIVEFTNGCGQHIIDITKAIDTYCTTIKNQKINITKCIDEQKKLGKTYEDARKKCERDFCPATCDFTNHDITDEYQSYIREGYTYNIALSLAEIDDGCYNFTCPCDCYGKQQQINDKYSLSTKNEMKTLVKNNKNTAGYGTSNAVEIIKNKKCTDYKKEYSCEYDKKNNGDLKCLYEFENKGTISNSFIEVENTSKTTSCSVNIAIGTKITKTKTGNCDVYCSEKSTLTLPGHVKETIKSGTSFEWPTIGNKSLYKMNINTKIICTVVDSNNSGTNCGSIDTTEFLKEYNYKDDVNLKYGISSESSKYDDDYAATISLKGNRSVSCKNCDNLKDSNKGRPDNNNTFIIDVITEYQLKDDLNRAIDSNGIYFNYKDDSVRGTTNKKQKTPVLPLLLLKKSSLAVSKNAKGYYELQLNLDLGRNGEFGTNLKDYKCNYKVDNDTTDQCICPTGTKQEGKDIAYLADCMNKVCTMAQIELCNVDVIDEEKYAKACVCKYNDKTVDLSDCMKEYDFKYCYNLKCNDNGFCTNDCTWKKTETKILSNGKTMKKWKKYCKNGNTEEECDTEWTCPGCGDNDPKNCDMNPTPCIQSKLGYQNLDYALKKGWITESQLNKALIACEQVVCPYGGKKIIYRVIDLDDPFPGMTLEGNATNFTNTSTKGRYPGYNWNNELWVQNKIRKVVSPLRSVDKGKNIYNEKPLYTIELTPSDIREIRKYNKGIKYTDWKDFICENGTCISKFLRNSEYSKILKSGICSNTNTPSQLRQCYESYSSSSTLSTYKN